MNLPGRTVIVTGGASGLGLAFARHLATLGGRVWALDRDGKALAAARAADGYDSSAPRFIQCEVGDDGQAADAVERIDDESGGIDILVNNAAVLRDQTLVSKVGRNIRTHSLTDWQDTINSNLTGTFLMAREVARTMIERRQPGLIVNISSISRHGNPGQSAYAASKAGIDALTVTWSQELSLYGIRVVAIAPGFVETPMTAAIPPLFLDQIRERTPLKRFGTLDELTRTLVFVIETDYLNGKTLEVDGGLRF